MGFEYQHDTPIGYVEDTVHVIDSFGEFQLINSPVLSTYSNDTHSFHGITHHVFNDDVTQKDDEPNEEKIESKQPEVIDLTTDTEIDLRSNNNISLFIYLFVPWQMYKYMNALLHL